VVSHAAVPCDGPQGARCQSEHLVPWVTDRGTPGVRPPARGLGPRGCAPWSDGVGRGKGAEERLAAGGVRVGCTGASGSWGAHDIGGLEPAPSSTDDHRRTAPLPPPGHAPAPAPCRLPLPARPCDAAGSSCASALPLPPAPAPGPSPTWPCHCPCALSCLPPWLHWGLLRRQVATLRGCAQGPRSFRGTRTGMDREQLSSLGLRGVRHGARGRGACGGGGALLGPGGRMRGGR